MANQQETVKFYGGVVKRVLIVYQNNSANQYNYSTLQFIKTRFNTTRNYREFTGNYPVEILEATSDKLPRITTLKEGDACLLIGCGRLIDKETYEFAKKCFLRNIPVFFIRANTAEYDHRVNDSPIWKTNTLVVKTPTGKKFFIAPKEYFMEIPSIDDILVTHSCTGYYALFPGMVALS